MSPSAARPRLTSWAINIYVSPQKNLIILRFGKSYGEFGGSQDWLDLFYGFASNLVE